MNITEARYCIPVGETEIDNIRATIDNQELSIPLDPANRHYAEIMRQVAAGELTIADAE